MPLYKICPNCGANLDPCEKCDCQKGKEGRHNDAEQRTQRNDNPVLRTGTGATAPRH